MAVSSLPIAFARLVLTGALVFAPFTTLRAADANPSDQAWGQLIALDAGPKIQARTSEEARATALAHLERQEKVVRQFLAAYPTDSRAFEARIRLVRILQISADVQGDAKESEEGNRLLEQLAKVATPEQRPEVDFARITFLMRTMRSPQPAQRDQLLGATRKFQTDHPDDRRLGSLLAEVAQLFTLQPKVMRGLLMDAERSATQPELRAQISDDLKRLDLIGLPLALQFTTAEAKAVDLAQFRGSVVILVFFAGWSKPSLEAVESVQRAAAQLPAGRVQVVGISLDARPEPLAKLVKVAGITWPIAYDGKAWESQLVRSLGINALPSVWLLDRQGRVRSLNGLESTVNQATQLLNER